MTSGGLINIVSYGSQDLYLTGAPEVSFFKTVYRRYTNFSMESYEIPFDNTFKFGCENILTFQKIGDLVHKAYIKIKIPEISFNRIVYMTDINNANNNYHTAVANLKKIMIFMNVNINAYRAALSAYQANNILYCSEMVSNITNVFNSYISNTETMNAITYFTSNSPLVNVPPKLFNIQMISNSILNPSSFPKESFKIMLDSALHYSKMVQKYYEDELNNMQKIRLDVANKNFKFAWVDRLGHSIIEYVSMYVGGEKIDKHYGEWIDIWYELSGKKAMEDVYFKMIGNVSELTSFDRMTKPEYTLYIPLQFWFSRFNGLALPLISFEKNNDISMILKLRKFSECSYIEDMTTYSNGNYKKSANLDDMFVNNGYVLYGSLLVDYVFLDTLERRRFAQSAHEYLIEQTQMNYLENIDISNVQTRLDFVNPSKELVWIVRKESYLKNPDGFTKCRWHNYTFGVNNKGQSIKDATLSLNSHPLFDRVDGKYFNYVQPYYKHSNSPGDGIYVYSFSLNPEEQQPSGSCNFSRIGKIAFDMVVQNSMFMTYLHEKIDGMAHSNTYYNNSVHIMWFCVNYNVLRIISGIAGTAFL